MSKISSNKLILGTVQFGLDYGINNKLGKPNFKQSCEILSKAFDNGITTLDTAEAYGRCSQYNRWISQYKSIKKI